VTGAMLVTLQSIPSLLQAALTTLQSAALVSSATAAATALVGAFVAYQAYRGYRRNDSGRMLYLAIGILLLTTVPVVIRQPLVLFELTTRAQAGLVAQTCRVLGLLAVLYSFS
jgi:hypothetical protein